MLNHLGYVAEATGDNIFLVRGRTLITPPAWCGCLIGITRNAVMKIAADNGFEVRESVLTRYDLYTADEVFLTGTAAEIVPVVEIDKRAIGGGVPGAGTKQLMHLFRAFAADPAHGTAIA